MKCHACHEEEAHWAWQPFGPDKTPESFQLLGSHYRGFPVVKVCSSCKSAFQTGDFVVRFTYKGYRFIATDHQVQYEEVSLWNGGTTTSASLADQSVAMLMRDTIGEPELVALVLDPSFVPVFIAAPGLIRACEKALALRDTLERYLHYSHVEKADRDALLLAFASIAVALREARPEGGQPS
jgi:hypothetical protein